MFIEGESYRRRELHATYGGQQQGGISTPVNYPIIFLFAGETGEQYGYADGWSDDDVYLYTGEGQTGDMQFRAGNRAIRDHEDNGKDLHLFQYVRQGFVRYLGQMVCVGYHFRRAPDQSGNLRQVIVFELTSLGIDNPRGVEIVAVSRSTKC